MGEKYRVQGKVTAFFKQMQSQKSKPAWNMETYFQQSLMS